MFEILLLQGANGNYLGKREPSVYGSTTVDQLDTLLHQHAHEKGYSLEIFYTNIEGEAIKQRANEHQRVTGFPQHGTGVGLSIEYVLAQMSVTEPGAARPGRSHLDTTVVNIALP